MAKRRGKTQKTLERECKEWNDKYPVGTLVKYFPVIGEYQHYKVYPTLTPAELLSGHTPVLWLKGKGGCVALEACEPVDQPEAEAK